MPNREARLAAPLTRRAFTRGAAWTGLGLAGLAWAAPAEAQTNAATDGATPLSTSLLEQSGFAYISPLHADGRESTCHAELWYAWLDEAVVVTVARDRWKARALARGLDRARVWIGDHGRWKNWYGGTNEAFRKAPHFDARVSKVPRGESEELLERLLARYEEKYPAEIADWRERMRSGNADGSRVLLRYARP